MTRARGCALALAACMLSTGVATAATSGADRSLTLDPSVDAYSLVEHVEYFEDESRELPLEEVQKVEGDRWFTSPLSNPNFGFKDSAYWVRLQLRNPSTQPVRTVMAFQYPLLDRVTVYVVGGAGEVERHVLGDRYAFSERRIKHTELTWELATPPGEEQWVYAQVTSDSSVQLGLSLESVPGFIERTTRIKLFHGLYYGIMLVMALYNLFLYLTVRIRAYLIYVCFVVIFAGTQLALDGVATRYFFADWPALANTFTPFIVVSVQIPTILFSQAFLESKRIMPRVHVALNAYMAFVSLGFPLALFASYDISIRFAAFMAIATSILSLSVGIYALRVGFRAARFFVLAWTALITGTVAYVLMTVGVLPANELTTNIQRIGSAIEVSLLSFALGDRINTVEREREAAHARALALDQDLLLTAAVQQLFLPKKDRHQAKGVDLVGFYRPADRSGGDWWWHEVDGAGRTRVLVGDIAGHGAAAAMLTGAVAASYQNIAKAQRDQPLPDSLRALAQSFHEISEGMHHMSIAALEIDPAHASLRLWSAGAPPVLVVRASGQVVSLLASGSLIGDEELDLGDCFHRLENGDRILVFSDGLPEMNKPSGRQLGYAGVSRLLTSTREQGLLEARAAIEANLDAIRGDALQMDDFCFVLIDVALG